MDPTQRRGRSYRHYGYDCWTEDQIRKQLGRLRLFPHEKFLRAIMPTDHRQQTGACDLHLLTFAFGDILWIPNTSASGPTPFGVNLTQIQKGCECSWSTSFCAQIIEACMEALALFPTDPQQANDRISNLLNLRKDSRKPIGWLHPANQRAVPIGLFCPQTCSIRRSIVIVGQRGLRKEAVLKYIWALAPDAFHIPSMVFEVDDIDEEFVTTGAHWPLALSNLDDAFRNWKEQRKKHIGNGTVSHHFLTGTARKAGAQLSSEMLACARRTVKSGRIPIVVVAFSLLGEWRASAELAAFVVLLQSANAKICSLVAPDNIDICFIHTPSDPAKAASEIAKAFYNINTGKGSSAIPWKPEIWYTACQTERSIS